MRKLISVIVPMYNAEQYISQCIHSILGQSYKNFELILVNDGSTDKTLEICENLTRNKNQTKIINIRFKSGVSNARNEGIREAEGEFICFADSDDYLQGNALELMSNGIMDFDLMISGYYNKFSGQSIKINYSINMDCSLEEMKEKFHIYYRNLLMNVVWNKMYRKDIIIKNNIKFNSNLKVGEDLDFNLSYYDKCQKIRFIEEAVYFYRNVSLLEKEKLQDSIQTLENQWNLFHRVKVFCKYNTDQIDLYFQKIVLDELYNVYFHPYIKKDTKQKKIAEILLHFDAILDYEYLNKSLGMLSEHILEVGGK